MEFDDNLLQFATERERQYLLAIQTFGSMRRAASGIGIQYSAMKCAMKRLRKRAAIKGYSPSHDMTHTVPDGFVVRGVSTYYNKDGKPSGQWVKSSADDERRAELMREAVEALKEELPRYAPANAPSFFDSDLLTTYVLTDFHLGMKAWGEETGAEDWDLEIAERLLADWFGAAIRMAPASETAVLANLGDFLHWDGWDAVTPQHKHLLDADTRFQKLVRVAIRVIRRIINGLLEKHNSVHVLMCDANHDPASGAWLRELLAVVYEDEPRVSIDLSADTYYCVEHGKTALFFHHGHKRGVGDVDRVFASKFRQIYGATEFAYAHLGHLHSNEVKESQLMVVERHRTLSAPDAYAAKGGWISGRDAKAITYHREFGEVSRLVISPDMVRRSA